MIWIISALLEVLAIKRYINSFDNGNKSGFAFILIIIHAILLFNPFKYLYRAFRFELLYSLAHNIIAPFGLVRFKDFFLGDVLTSLVKPLIDVYFVMCFF